MEKYVTIYVTSAVHGVYIVAAHYPTRRSKYQSKVMDKKYMYLRETERKGGGGGFKR